MTRDWSSVGAVPRETVVEMVNRLQPSWSVESIERTDHGTDFVAMLDVRTPEGERRVVLKATTAEWVPAETARAEPRVLSTVGERTEIPVPSVFGVCEDSPDYPTPFFLMSYVEGQNYEGERPSLAIRRRTLGEAGRNLAALHGLDVLETDRIGRVGIQSGALKAIDTDEFSSGEQFHEWLLSEYEENLDSLADGGYFSELAEEPTRFADIVPDLRAYLRETIPSLPAPNPPVLCHNDYRYGNLLVDPETGKTQAVLDWGLLSAGPPAYNLATTESLMLAPEADGPDLTAELRERFRSAYTQSREGWRFDEATEERMSVYLLTCRIDAMACLPLWHQDASPAERDEVAEKHRSFVRQYL
jgi:aminoglycoside phosphotransferase (APT) family kinase protein